VKIDFEKNIGLFELDSNLTLRLKPLLNYFQEVVGIHSDTRGCGLKWLMDQGKAWVLHRIGIHIHRLPGFGDELKISTWYRGGNGFRAYRDFEILSKGEKIVSANSLWLFIDLNRKKILQVPEEADNWYTVEKDKALDLDIDTWRPNLNFEPETVKTIGLRPSDYDPLGHVNNALYFDFLENLTSLAFDDKRRVQQVVMQFNKEILKGMDTVKIGMRKTEDHYEYKLFSHEGIHAAGNFLLFPEQDSLGV